MVDKIAICIEIINVLRILSFLREQTWNISCSFSLSLSFLSSRLLSLFFLHGKTAVGDSMPVNCVLDVQLARQHRPSLVKALGRVLWRVRKTQRKSGLVFQRATRARFRHVEPNQRVWLRVVDVISSKSLVTSWHTRDNIHETVKCFFICWFYDSRGHALWKISNNSAKLSFHFANIGWLFLLENGSRSRVKLDIESICNNFYS